MAHSLTFLANQKARNTIVGAENLLKTDILLDSFSINQTHTMFWEPRQIGVLPKLTYIDVHTHGEPQQASPKIAVNLSDILIKDNH